MLQMNRFVHVGYIRGEDTISLTESQAELAQLNHGMSLYIQKLKC